jgi:hypothetical protein
MYLIFDYIENFAGEGYTRERIRTLIVSFLSRIEYSLYFDRILLIYGRFSPEKIILFTNGKISAYKYSSATTIWSYAYTDIAAGIGYRACVWLYVGP